MSQELLFRLFAHSSLLLYIAVYIFLLIYYRSKVNNKATQSVYAAMFIWFILLTKDLSYLFGDTWYDTEVTNMLMSLDLWPLPIMVIVVLYILQPMWLNIIKGCYIFSPFFVLTILNIIFKGDPAIFLTTQVLGLAFATVFVVLLLILTYKCAHYINANYSNTELINIIWMRYLIAFMYLINFAFFFISVESTWLGDGLFYIFSALVSYFLFFFLLKHQRMSFPNFMTVSRILNAKKQKKTNNCSACKEADQCPDTTDCDTAGEESMDSIYENIQEKLDVAILQDKVYLNPDLSLTDLAVTIGTNRTYLSRYINGYKATSFVNYINEFRLSEAYSKLSDPQNTLSLIEVSETSGFTSYSTFRRVFKQKYGYPPSKIKEK